MSKIFSVLIDKLLEYVLKNPQVLEQVIARLVTRLLQWLDTLNDAAEAKAAEARLAAGAAQARAVAPQA